MTREQERRAKALFTDALEIALAERDAFVQAGCDGDPAVAERVHQLIGAHEQAGAFLSGGPSGVGAPPSAPELGRDTLWRAIGRALDVPTQRASLQAGDTLSGYRIRSRIGIGGMGSVYAAERTGHEADDLVAIKLVHPHLMETAGFFKRFLREARVGQELNHENVVRALDCDAVIRAGQHHHFLVMEHVEGQTLGELLGELGRVPEELCRHVARAVARGLAAIHGLGVVHRDIKPDNVMITNDHIVKIMDMGVARIDGEVLGVSGAGGFVGSLEYAAPEQLDVTLGETDARTDLHALGVVLYELATGQHPYRRDDARELMRRVLDGSPRRAGQVNPQLSPFFEEIVHTLIERAPEDRFASAEDLLCVLEEGEGGAWWAARAQGLRLETMRPLRRIQIPRETRLCGREEELARLFEAFGACEAGSGRVLLIEGEAGIGKTRLIDEFLGRLEQERQDTNILFGSYAPGVTTTSAGALSEAYAQYFGPDGSAAHLQAAPMLAPAFDAVLRGGVRPGGAQGLTHDSLGTCFAHATKSLAKERPTIVVIDDLHFASQNARSIFAHLASAIPDHRVLLLGTMRPTVPRGWISDLSRPEHVSHVELARLGPKDLTELLVDAFQSSRLAEELGFRIAHKSDGNPFFALEIIRGLREGQFISQRRDGSWFRTSAIGELAVPSSVTGLVRARMQDLSDTERELLDVAACAGFEFDPELVARVVGMEVVPALRAFGRIESQHRLVRSAGRDLVFDHHQVQESLYADLLERLRTRYHASIAEQLEARTKAADADENQGVRICSHFLRGRQGHRALPYLEHALAHLHASYRSEEAISLIDEALAVPDLLLGEARFEASMKKYTELALLGRLEEQEDALRDAGSLADTLGPASALRVGRAWGDLCSRTGRYSEAEEHFARCLELARDVADREAEASTTGSLGAVRLYRGQFEEARTLFERHRDLSHALGHRAGETNAQINLATALIRLGRHDEALTLLHPLLESARQTGPRTVEVHILLNLTLVYSVKGQHAEVLAPIGHCLELARSIGYRNGEVVAMSRLANALHALGRYEPAQEHAEQWLALAEEIGNLSAVSYALHMLAELCVAQGRYGDAIVRATRHLALAREIGARPSESRALRSIAQVQFLQGRYEEARRNMACKVLIDEETSDRQERAASAALLGEIALAEGDADGAVRYHSEAVEIRKELSDARVASSLTSLARIALLQERTPEALARATEALDMAEEHQQADTQLLAAMIIAAVDPGALPAAQQAGEHLADRSSHRARTEAQFRLWELTGSPEHLKAAHLLLAAALSHTDPEHREAMAASVPLHAAVQAAWDLQAE